MPVSSSAWSPSSWQTAANGPAAQQPCYPDARELSRVIDQLAKLPPLVTSWEIESLKSQLAEAAEGRRFLLQGGDCAESFDDCDAAIIANKLKILLQMSLVLVHGMRKRVIRVGRFAGQYAKQRSSDVETRELGSEPVMGSRGKQSTNDADRADKRATSVPSATSADSLLLGARPFNR